MNKIVALIAVSCIAISLGACRSHPEMQYKPFQYAKLRGIELLTTPPTREFELVVNVEGFGGQYTAKETMINGMIDAAHKAGARALIPMEFTGEGQAKAATGLDVFVHVEKGRTITKGRAIRWVGN